MRRKVTKWIDRHWVRSTIVRKLEEDLEVDDTMLSTSLQYVLYD